VFLLLEVADVGPQRDDEAVVEALVDALQPASVRKLLDGFRIGHAEGGDPFPHPVVPVRRRPAGEPRAVADAALIDLLAHFREGDADAQAHAEGIEEVGQLGIVIDQRVRLVVDADPDIEEVQRIFELQVLLAPALAHGVSSHRCRFGHCHPARLPRRKECPE